MFTGEQVASLFLTTQVASVVHARLEATAPWGLNREAHAAEGTANHSAQPAISPLQVAHFGMVTRGHCWLSIEGIPDAMPLDGGDCFLLAPGSSYTLRDNPRTRARGFCEVAPRDGSQVIHCGGGVVRIHTDDTHTMQVWIEDLIVIWRELLVVADQYPALRPHRGLAPPGAINRRF